MVLLSIRNTFFFLLSLSLALPARADLDKPTTYKEVKIYRETLKLCKSDKFTLEALTDVSGYTAMASIVFDSALEVVTDLKLGVSSNIQEILSEYWFYRALNECYGDNRIRKDFFVITLLAADRVGKIGAAFGMAYGAAKAAGYVVGLAGKMKLGYTVNVLRYSADPKIAVQILNKTASPKLYAAYYAFNTAVVVDSAIDVVKGMVSGSGKKDDLSNVLSEDKVIDELQKQQVDPSEKAQEDAGKQRRDQLIVDQARAQIKYLEDQLRDPQLSAENRTLNLSQIQKIKNSLRSQGLIP